jgi:hypothetical protein
MVSVVDAVAAGLRAPICSFMRRDPAADFVTFLLPAGGIAGAGTI